MNTPRSVAPYSVIGWLYFAFLFVLPGCQDQTDGATFEEQTVLIPLDSIAEPPVVYGLDHIPVAVSNLDEASIQYRNLGFTLKKGRFHSNGIENVHAKFGDGSEIELITVSEPTDALTAEYGVFLRSGDGPSFLALFANDLAAVQKRLDKHNYNVSGAGGILTFPQDNPFRYLFFGIRNASPTDRPEHFNHPNTARTLERVWLAKANFNLEHVLFSDLGLSTGLRTVFVPNAVETHVTVAGSAEIILLPASFALTQNRPIVGATVRVSRLAAVDSVLAVSGIRIRDRVRTDSTQSLFVPPESASGMWLEFREHF